MHQMTQSFRHRFLLFALPFIVAIALLAALQPRLSTASAVPAAFFRGHPFHERGEAGGDFGRTFPPEGRRGAAREQPFVPAAPPLDGYTVDGWRLLAALALSGAFTGLVWLTLDAETPVPTQSTQRTLLEQDVARLREELDSLHREQRQVRETLDWQGRLLTGQHDPQADT